LPNRIVGLGVFGMVRSTVDLDRQLQAGAIEVENERSYRMLAPELESCQLSAPQERPQQALA
jgi:hypothetical protein